MAAREPTIFEQATDPERFPWRLDFVIRKRIELGLTDEETVTALRNLPGGFRIGVEWQRLYLIRTAAIRRVLQRPEPRPNRPGPKPSTTAEAVEAERRRLEQDGAPAGERSIAEKLGVSKGAVRYALGKDRRKSG